MTSGRSFLNSFATSLVNLKILRVHHNDYSSYFALFFRLTVTVQQVYVLYRNLEYMLKRSVVSRTCVLVYGILYHDPQIKANLIRC